jgi:hypothetical protein
MKFSKLLIIVFLLNCATLSANDNISFLSPGIKLGYVFGNNGGFVIGFELSYVYWSQMVAVGPVFNIDSFNGTIKLHFGLEALSIVGVDLGPTLVIKNGQSRWGYSVIGFGGFLIYPYYCYTSIGNNSYDEIGSYFKLPILATGRIQF